MRTSICGLLLIIVTGMVSGCASNSGIKSDAQAVTQADKAAGAKPCVMQSGGTDVLQLTLPADTKFVAKDASLDIHAPQFEVEFWLIHGAQTVDDAVGRIGQEIKDQFKDFKTTHTSDLTIAGSPAKRLVGSGHEADDGDAGQADVIVFKVGEHVFIACTHGEDLTAMAQAGLLTVTQTAQTP